MPIRCKNLFCVLLILVSAPIVRGAGPTAWQDSATSAVAVGNVFPDASSLAVELQRIGNLIEKEKTNPAALAVLRKELLSHWEVTAGEHRYYLSAEPLNALLHDAEKEKDAKNIEAKAGEAADWVFDLANQVKGYARAQNGGGASASVRASLERILSRREFGGTSGPSPWQLFRQRVNRWIGDLLLRFFRQIGRYPIGAKVLFWFIIVAVVVWLAVVLFRYWTRRAALEELQAPESVTYARAWQEWIQAAREAASRGDFREAVHSAYWAGISYLEDSELVRKDRTRTPREYMRLVSNSTQLVASGRKTREALSALTVALEQVWYGGRRANSQDFANALQSVEALGCQLQ
jgi:hypothetical protein